MRIKFNGVVTRNYYTSVGLNKIKKIFTLFMHEILETCSVPQCMSIIVFDCVCMLLQHNGTRTLREYTNVETGEFSTRQNFCT